MPKQNWWANRTGRFAKYSSYGGSIPRYASTVDVATTPWESSTQFDALEADQAAEMKSKIMDAAYGIGQGDAQSSETFKNLMQYIPASGISREELEKQMLEGQSDYQEEMDPDGWWGAVTDGLDHIKDAGSWALDKGDALLEKVPYDDKVRDVAKMTPAGTLLRQSLWLSEQANEYGATVLTAASLSDDSVADMFKGKTWTDAHNIVEQNHLDIGQAGMLAFFYDDGGDVLNDHERIMKLQATSGIYNVGSLGLQMVATWKYDPLVVFGRAGGAAMRFARGDISQYVARDLRDMATGGAFERAVASKRARTLFDRWNDEILPLARDPKVSGEEFARAFDRGQNVNGRVMAELVREVAGDERLENLAFRTFIGDKKALAELGTERNEIAEKIDAIQNTHKPGLLNDMSIVDEAIKARDNEMKQLFGEADSQDTLFSYLSDEDKARVGVSAGDDWLDLSAEKMRERMDELDTTLLGYTGHEKWLQRMLSGTGERGDALNAVAGAMNTISSKTGRSVMGAMHQGYREGLRPKSNEWTAPELPKVSVWQKSWLSPVHTVWTVPRTWFLKHNNFLNLHDADGTSRAVSSWLDSLETMTGRYDPAARGVIIDRIGRAGTDAQRLEIAQDLDEMGIRMIGQKYGLSYESMQQLSRMIVQKRRRGWEAMGEKARYSTVKREDGSDVNLFEWYDGENRKNSVKMPLDVTELQNSHMLVNLRDLDWIVRRNRDLLGELDQAYQMSRTGKAFVSSRRMAMDMFIDAGTALNSIWKPLALLSIRWPMRVVGDEATRWSLLGANALAREGGSGLMHMFWNNGVARPIQWRKERGGFVKTGDIREEPAEVADAPYDMIDTKMANGNITGAMPFEAAELNRMNPARYEALSALQSERREIYRTRLLDKTAASKPLPAHMQKWDDRMKQAEKNGQGFIVDPLNEKAFRNGYATSIYPGKIRTFSSRPSHEDFRRYVDDNIELFSNGRNRLGIWFDRQYGMWVMDVVRGHKGKESALGDIRRAEQDHFYDVSDNFSRYTRETEGPQVRKTGRQRETYKTYDGKTIEAEPALGDIGNPNIYFSMAGSKGAMANLYGSHTFAQESSRRSGFKGGYQTIETDNAAWSSATADYVNNHFRQSPVWQKMLAGQSDDQIISWLRRTPQGRELRQRIGPRGADPEGYISDMRLVLNQHLPNEKIRALAAQRELKPMDIEEGIAQSDRHDVHGATLDNMSMQGSIADWYKRRTDWLYEKLGSLPTDKLVRHPMFASQYRLKMRNLVGSHKADDLTPQVQRAFENAARNYALKQVRRYMFQLGDDFNGVRMFRFISPFFQAQVEVIERYLKLIGEHPETIGRLVGMANVTGGAHGPIAYTVNEEGERTKDWDWNGSIVVQWPKSIIKHVPGFKEWSKVYGSVPIPTSSVNLILQGEQPWLPSAGPMVTIPAMKYYEHRMAEGHLEDVNSAPFKWLFPYGMPRDSLDAFLPAWGRRVRTMFLDESKDPAFATEQAEVYRVLMVDWEQGGRVGDKPTMADANRVVKKQYMVRAFTGFMSPVPVNTNTKYQFYIDQARKYYDKFGPIKGGKKFYEEFGPTLYRFWSSSSDTYGDMPATLEAAQTYGPLKDLYEKSPLMAGILAGPATALGEYNYDVYRWQLSQPIAPGSTQTLRKKLSPEEVLAQNNVDRGWIEWETFEKAMRVELRNRGLTSPEQDEELMAWREQQQQIIGERNPGWLDAYNSRTSEMDTFLRQANDVIWDKRLDNRIDIQGLRQYMVMREEMTTLLAGLQQSGQTSSSSISATSDPIIAELNNKWKAQVFRLTSQNLLFAEIYDRWLSNDDLESARLM